MATYVLPQVLVFQDFELGAEVDLQNLNAFITGPHAFLLRYDDEDEKPLALLGTYDHVGTLIDGEYKTCYSWPSKPAGSLIDDDYTKLFIDNALLRYWRDTSHTMTKTAANKVRHPTKAFKENPDDPDSYPRHTDFLDRDVRVGDIVVVSGIPTVDDDNSSATPEVAGDRVYLSTYVKDIEADVVAAVVETAESNDNNQATQTLSTDHSANDDNSGDATIASVSGAAYDGHEDGDLSEIYTIRVTQGSTGGDATTARLQVRSASGRDDQAEITPAAFGSPTDIGDRGLTVTWSGGSSEFVQDDEWTVEVNQAFTAPDATSGGDYTGTKDALYIIEVTKGGLYADDPEITVTTTDGTDFSGPTVVPAASTAVAIGTRDVTVSFNGTALRKGDRYTISALAETEGAFKTLVMGHDLDDDIDLDDADTALLEVTLYIKKNIEVAEKHVRIGGQYNWDQGDTEFCVHAGIEAYDDSWTEDGEPVALEVIADEHTSNTNQLYVEYRAWRSDLADSVREIDDVANLDDEVSGALHPDNPLKWALFKALSNNNGQPVKYMAVADPDDTDDWITVLDAIEDRPDVYGLVPLTRNKTILDLFAAHVQSQSTEIRGRWRVLWVNLQVDPTQVVLDETTTDDEEVLLATTEDDPETSGTQYTRLKITSGNAELIVAGVRPGDVVRYLYTADAWGDVTYSEFPIDAVINEVTLRLTTGTDVAENTPKKIEIWRNLSVEEQSEVIGAQAGNWASRRIRAVWPDTISSGGTEMEGYHLCAALAALSGGVQPHQGLTYLEIAGFDDVSRTTKVFNRGQLDDMALNGTWIVTQHPQSGEVYSRHALTTGDYEVITEREEMLTRNLDSISFYWLDKFSPYIGISNATPNMLDIIESETRSGIEFLRGANFSQRLGAQLIDATITELRISPVFKDRIVLALDYTLPFPLNNIEVHQTVLV